MDWKAAIEEEVIRLTIQWVVWSLIGYAIAMWLLYLVIKAAVREGIKESGLIKTWQTLDVQPRWRDTDNLPEIRADK